MINNPIILTSPQGVCTGEVDLIGGMLSSLNYKGISILHRASWLKDQTNYFANAKGLLNHLSGDFACVPFGFTTQDSSLFKQDAPHGLPCHNQWEVVNQSKSHIVLRYIYPQDYPLESVERTISLDENGAHFTLSVLAREDVNTTLGVHPIFPLTGEENKLELEIKGRGIVYGIECEKGISRLKVGENFTSLKNLPLKDGSSIDASILPFNYDTEEIVQMLDPQGEAILNYKNKGVRVILNWDQDKIKTCLLWISNRGRKYEPWGGKNCCLGIEPIIGAWDLADLSLQDNVINAQNIQTSVLIKAKSEFKFNHHIQVETL